MKILVVEDDKHLREGLVTLLTAEGYDCIDAADGVAALSIHESFSPDLCVFDIMMPRMDGIALCKIVRKRTPKVSILFLTALDQDVDQIKGLNVGADDYIAKPFNPDTLLARVRALLRRSTMQNQITSKQMKYRAFVLNQSELSAYYHNKSVELSQRESDFLTFLLEHPNIALDRNQIFDQCWHRDFIPNSRSLDQFVLVLRQKLEQQLGTPRFIKTVYGQGYMFAKHKLDE